VTEVEGVNGKGRSEKKYPNAGFGVSLEKKRLSSHKGIAKKIKKQKGIVGLKKI